MKILIAFIVLCVCAILYKLVSKGEKKLQERQKPQQPKSNLTPEQTHFLQTVGRLFKENRAMTLLEVYEECGIPHDVVYSRNNDLLRQHIPFEKGSDADNVFMTYALAVSKRYGLLNEAIPTHPNDVLQINLHKDEAIYHVIYGVVLYQEKTTVTNVTYTGYRWTSGPMRMGNLNVMTNEITRMSPVDVGHLVFTNQRLIFIGKQKNVNKQVKLADILFCNMYQDGVMVHMPNKKPLVFKFPENKDFEIYQISDGINEFALIYDRLRNGTYSENLVAPKPAIAAQSSSFDFSAELSAKGYDELVNDIIKSSVKGEPLMTSSIQRKYEIGYARAGRITDQLECLGILSGYDNGKRVWLVSADEPDKIGSLIEAAKPYN